AGKLRLRRGEFTFERGDPAALRARLTPPAPCAGPGGERADEQTQQQRPEHGKIERQFEQPRQRPQFERHDLAARPREGRQPNRDDHHEDPEQDPHRLKGNAFKPSCPDLFRASTWMVGSSPAMTDRERPLDLARMLFSADQETQCGRPVWFSRSRNCLPVLKNGMCFSATCTLSPVRGLRPTRASRRFTENAPKPRNSTRSPRARAPEISSKIAVTIASTSR